MLKWRRPESNREPPSVQPKLGIHRLAGAIFDEPEAGIDLWSFSMLIRRFEEIHKEKKECLILISHQERIIQMADKIMVIEDGQVKEYGTKEDVLPTLFQQKTGRMCGQEGGIC